MQATHDRGLYHSRGKKESVLTEELSSWTPVIIKLNT